MVIVLGKIIEPAENRYYTRGSEKDLEEELFNYPVQNTDTSDLYAEFFESKLSSLRRQIREIDIELGARQSIHRQLVEEIDHQVLSASLFLNQLKHWAIGYRVGVDMERNLWERKIGDLTKEKRSERVRLWRDSVRVNEDRRELTKEYEELLKRRHLLR
jgi:hypothetical protein